MGETQSSSGAHGSNFRVDQTFGRVVEDESGQREQHCFEGQLVDQ